MRDRRLAARSRRLTRRRASGELLQRACTVCVLTVCVGLGAAAGAVLLPSAVLALVSVAILLGALIIMGTLLMTLALRDRHHE
jgi:Na+/proline symporter